MEKRILSFISEFKEKKWDSSVNNKLSFIILFQEKVSKQTQNFEISISISTQIYFIFQFKNTIYVHFIILMSPNNIINRK
jgi:hypothetical protein